VVLKQQMGGAFWSDHLMTGLFKTTTKKKEQKKLALEGLTPALGKHGCS
jgi:hypothetical protein